MFNLSRNNTRLRLKTLGEVELKHISLGDTDFFLKILAKEKISDREFVKEILYNQLIKPQINFEKFRQLSDKDLIKIAKTFVENEDHTFQYFKDTGDFFKDFQVAVITYVEKQLEMIKKNFEPIIKSTQETLKAFNKNYAPIIQQSFEVSSYIKESLQGITKIAERFQETQVRLAESFKPIIERFQSMRIVAESLKLQIDFLQKWTEQNKSIFENVEKFWADFQVKYKIDEQKAVRVLQKYKWFITPSLPISFVFVIMQLDKKKGRHDQAVNKFFIDYFSSNNWQNLEIMVDDWRDKPLLKKKRIKILTDCVQTLKEIQSKKINEANVILPTLITQIDGVLTDYLNSKNIQWGCEYDDFIRKGKVEKVGRKSQFQKK